MRLALALAARGLGQVWPNPAVGCVIVRDGRVLGRGWTQPTGRPHAEPVALTQAGDAARGATAFVTLEPCAHTGKTPPCATALIGAGIARLVCATTDPDPRVSGKGIAMLRDAGITVDQGVLEPEARLLNAGFLKRVETGLPHLTLKLATSVDGRIATANGNSKWITNAASREYVHHLRACHDAILVGSGTALADDPDLRVRLAGQSHRSPVRIILDTNGRLSTDSRLIKTAHETPVWLCHDSEKACDHLAANGVSLIGCRTTRGRLDLRDVLKSLAARGITRVFCEGGGTLAAGLINAGLVDELITFQAGVLLGGDGIPATGDLNLNSVAEATRFTRIETRSFGDDTMSIWRPV